MNLAASTAVVTGAASGLGRATARALAARGVPVVLVDLPSSDGKQMRGPARLGSPVRAG